MKSFISPQNAYSLIQQHGHKALFTTMQNAPASKPDIITSLVNPLYIPNSIFFDFQNDITDKTAQTRNMMPSTELFEQKMQALGINNSDSIVVYDDFGNFCASRVWFMLRAMGCRQVFVIDGGLPAWLRAELPTTDTLLSSKHTGDFTASPDSQFQFVDRNVVRQHCIEDDSCSVLDARSALRFKQGHIPKSKNLPYSELQTEQGECLAPQQINAKLVSRLKGENALFSCGSGVTACILAQAAYEQGYQNLKVYDGSWSDWQANDMPVELHS